MPANLDSTIGGAASNTYASTAEAEAYLDERLNTLSWDSATNEAKSQALIMAARRLDRENWLGKRVNETQRLAWPRVGVRKPNSSYGIGWYLYSNIYEQYYRTDEIPEVIKFAQCELALAYLNKFSESADKIESYTIDRISVKKKLASPANGLPAEVQQYISGLIVGARLVRA